MATSEGIPSSIDIEFLELNDNPYYKVAHLGATAEGSVKQTTLYDNLAKKFA